jgi:hypothetical protein
VEHLSRRTDHHGACGEDRRALGRRQHAHDFSARLLTEDGADPVLETPDDGGVATPIEFQGRFEAGRPAGLAPGSELDAPFAVNIAGLPLPPGRYEWQVAIDGELVDRVAFTVMAA